MKLFAVLLGGRADGCNIELHDVVFTVAESLETSYQDLIKKWFGNNKRFHIDSSIELQQADGYDIQLKQEKPEDHSLKLFFVNFGAYKPGVFAEIHQSTFYVAESKNAALQRAKAELCLGLEEIHCDDNIIVDDIFAIECVNDYYIHFEKAYEHKPLNVISAYQKIKVTDAPESVI